MNFIRNYKIKFINFSALNELHKPLSRQVNKITTLFYIHYLKQKKSQRQQQRSIQNTKQALLLLRRNNAHFDNFVVIQNGSSILAPVDFDLAYCKEEFMNIDFDAQISNSQKYQENKNYGKFDLEQWLLYQDQERIGLELAIGGMDMILASHMFLEKQKTDIEEFYEILLRDQMRIGYLEGIQLKEDSSLFYLRMDQIQYA